MSEKREDEYRARNGLKDERRTSNVQHRTLNNDAASLLKLLSDSHVPA